MLTHICMNAVPVSCVVCLLGDLLLRARMANLRFSLTFLEIPLVALSPPRCIFYFVHHL